MNLYLIGFVMVFLSALISVDRNFSSNLKDVIFYFLLLPLLIFCALRGNIDRDHQNYINIYYYIVNNVNYLIEPSFYFLSYISKWLSDGPILLFVMYALLAVPLKLYTLKKYSILPIISIFVYFCNYYFLHEMTQVRVGVSVALAVIGITFWIKKEKSLFCFFIFLAFLFHYSALVFLVVPFLPSRRVTRKELLVYFLILCISYILYFSNFGLARIFSYIPIGFVQEKFTAYQLKAEMGDVSAVNVFNVMQILKILVVFLVYFFVPKSYHNNDFFNVMFRFYIFSCVSLVALFDIPAFSIRMSELFGFSEVFILPYLMYVSRKKLVGLTLITAACSVIFYINIYHNQLLLPFDTFWD